VVKAVSCQVTVMNEIWLQWLAPSSCTRTPLKSCTLPDETDGLLSVYTVVLMVVDWTVDVLTVWTLM